MWMGLAIDSVSDSLLFERVRRGDTVAFEALTRRHYRAAYAVALGVLGYRMDAEDACHDGFLQALRRWESCRQPDRFAQWICQIVRNQARTLARSARVRRTEPLEGHDAADGQDVDRALIQSELEGRLESALSQLTAVQREVLVLAEVDEWPHGRIAEFLEISEGMSRQHLFQARKALRATLGVETLEEYRHG
jgi:RNA polymerase sigma-70 factor (ECF subfamily)